MNFEKTYTGLEIDHDERGDQRQFVKEIEEENIEGGKRAEDAAAHHHQEHIKFLLPLFDRSSITSLLSILQYFYQ